MCLKYLSLSNISGRRSTVLYRTNDNVVKLLLWHDMIPVREDLYRLTELLEVVSRIFKLPLLIRRLIKGLQERFLQVAETTNYVEMMETFFQFKPMYHTCLNTYFGDADECAVWRYYVQSCLEWRNSVITTGCLERKYIPVDFLAKCPLFNNGRFPAHKGSETKLKAISEYLTFFGSEGKKFLGKTSYYDDLDIVAKVKMCRDKADLELAERERPNRPNDESPTTMEEQELQDKINDVETNFNFHITLIPYQNELITEAEFVERIERQRQGLFDYFTYSHDDSTDIVTKGIIEHFARTFQHLVELNGEQSFPFHQESGKVLQSIDRIEECIRNNKIRQKPSVSSETLHLLSGAKQGLWKYEGSPIDALFPSSYDAAIAMKLTQDEFLDMFGKKATKTSRKKGRVEKVDIELRQRNNLPNPKAIPISEIWNKSPGGVFLDEKKTKGTKRYVILSTSEIGAVMAAEALKKKGAPKDKDGFPKAEPIRNLTLPLAENLKGESTVVYQINPNGDNDKKEDDTAAPVKPDTKEADCSEVLADWMTKKCYVCGNKGQTKQCSRCHGVDYCSKKCQAQDWPDHKYLCGLIREESAETSTDESGEK